jgi:hypothetical protein
MAHSSMAECPPSREMVASATAQGDWPGSQWLPAALAIEWHRVWWQDALELAREVMPSLVNTLRRWYWTVRGLMNSRVPISGFESPSRARRAVCASCAVSSSRVSTVRFRTVSPVARSSRRARSAKASAPIEENIVGRSNLGPRVDAPVLATQPLAVQEVRPTEVDAHTRSIEALDGLLVTLLSDLSVAQQRMRARLDPERPLAAAGLRHLHEPAMSVDCYLALAASQGCLDKLGQRQVRHVVGVAGSLLRRRQRGLIAAEAVVQDRLRPRDHCQAYPLAAPLDARSIGIDQRERVGLTAAQGCEADRAVGRQRARGRLRRCLHFLQQRRRRRELAREQVRVDARREGEWKFAQRADLTGQPDLSAHLNGSSTLEARTA